MAGDRRIGERTVPVLRRVGAVAAFAAAALLVVGAFGLIVPAPGLGLRNWLVVFLQLSSGVGQLPDDALRLLNPLDLAILVTVGLAYLGLWPGPVQPHRFWTVVASALPFAGIVVLLVSGQAGRSAVMAAGIVVAILFALGRAWLLAALGIVANGALLMADFAIGSVVQPPIAVLVAVGYVLLVAWFAVLGARMLRRR
ncbi:hypothetical protein [Agromyces bauzanensis]